MHHLINACLTLACLLSCLTPDGRLVCGVPCAVTCLTLECCLGCTHAAPADLRADCRQWSNRLTERLSVGRFDMGDGMRIALVLVYAVLGGLLYRWRGSSLWTPPRPVLQAVIALPFAAAAPGSWLVAALVWIWTAGALCLGHGQYQGMGDTPEGTDRSSVDWLLRWMGGPPGGLARCVAGMALTGMLVTLPVGLALGSPVVALAGAGKSLCYLVGTRVRWQVLGDTSETLTGILFWGLTGYLLLG